MNKIYPMDLFLQDTDITEVLIDGYQHVYFEKDGKLEEYPSPFQSHAELIEMVADICVKYGQSVDQFNPIVDFRLADGLRFNVVMPQVAINGPFVTIRKIVIGGLTEDDLLNYHSLSQPMLSFLRACILARLNILVSGGVSSGKTSLLTVLARMIPDVERIILLQADEVLLNKPRLVRLQSMPASVTGKGEITMRQLAVNALRMRPDRIVTTEVRGAEVFELLQAMNNGHDGCLQSIHARNVPDALSRLESMIETANTGMSAGSMRAFIASAINLVIQADRLKDGSRKIIKISEVTGVNEGRISVRDIFEYQAAANNSPTPGYFTATGSIPSFIQAIQDTGIDLPASIFSPSSS